MKKLSVFILNLIVLSIGNWDYRSVYAQIIIPGSLGEYVNPSSASGPTVASNIAHTSNYHYEKIQFRLGDAPDQPVTNDLYVWAWGGINLSYATGSGIGWKRSLPGNPSVIVDDGYINFDKVVFDPEIAFIQHHDQIFVYVAYYVTRSYFGLGSNGHYYDVYRWDSGTLTPISVENLLSGEINYGRISIDALDLNSLAMTWETANGIYAKAFKSSPTGIIESPSKFLSYPGPFPNKAPDVAFFKHSDRIYTRLLFVSPLSDITREANYVTGYCLFDDFFTATTTFGVTGIDILPNEFHPNWGLDGLYHQIDCPDNVNDGINRYAISYYNYMDNKPYVRIKSPTLGVFPVSFDLIDIAPFSPFPNRKIGSTAVAYDPNPSIIHVGFHMNDYFIPANSNFLAVTYTDAGVKVGSALDYKAIANPPYNFGETQPLAFSKQNSRSSQVFTSYHKKIPVPYTLSEVLHKHALSPASYSTFSDFKSLNHNSSLHFDLYPNPSSVGTQIKLLEFNDGVLNLSCSDLSGQVLFTINGQLELINSQLLNEVSKLISGQYIITLSQGKSQFSQKFIKQ